REMTSRWAAALAEIHRLIERARERGGEEAKAASRAAELALVADEMIPRVERAATKIGELQARVDGLEVRGRGVRESLGRAIDVLLHDRSRERAHLDALHARRSALEDASRGAAAPSFSDPAASARDPLPRAWEIEALRQEEARAAAAVADLDFQI